MAKWSTTHNRVLAALAGAVLGLLVGGDARAEPQSLTEARQMAALPAKAILEVSLVADIDGDGHPDTAILGGTPAQRRLVVWFGAQDGPEAPVSAALGAPNSDTGTCSPVRMNSPAANWPIRRTARKAFRVTERRAAAGATRRRWTWQARHCRMP